MAVLPIKLYGSSILRTKAKPLDKIGKEEKKIISDMIDSMYADCGIGLAAPQIGVPKRIIVVDMSTDTTIDTLVIINPEIIETTGEIIMEEGCLSLPEIKAQIKRPEEVRVSGMNIKGDRFEIKANGLMARVLQHEIDHLNGILFIDKLSREEKKAIKNKLKYISRLANNNVDYYAMQDKLKPKIENMDKKHEK
jgi:peptide deformylase